MTTVGLIGYGGIAQDVVAVLREAGGAAKIAGVLCRPGRGESHFRVTIVCSSF